MKTVKIISAHYTITMMVIWLFDMYVGTSRYDNDRLFCKNTSVRSIKRTLLYFGLIKSSGFKFIVTPLGKAFLIQNLDIVQREDDLEYVHDDGATAWGDNQL